MKILTVCAALTALVVPAVAQFSPAMQEDYLDYYIVKVKPEKRADFEALAKKVVDANRKHQGDNWLTYQVEYGEGYTVYFVSPRKDMSAIDTASTAFMKAMKEAFGADTPKVFREWDACLISSRGEIRRRRWDLSTNPPKDTEESLKLVGASRFVRTMAVRIRPGRAEEFEAQAKVLKEAAEKNPEARTLVSQAVAGAPSGTYYFTSLKPNMAGFERPQTTLKSMLGDEAYAKFWKTVSEVEYGAETMIARFLPALSNPPEAVVNVSRDFWMPPSEEAPIVAARGKRNKDKDKDKAK